MSDADPRVEALRRLPEAYALALRLRDRGVTEEKIAERLGIDPTAVGPLLVLAEAKLRAMLGGSSR